MSETVKLQLQRDEAIKALRAQVRAMGGSLDHLTDAEVEALAIRTLDQVAQASARLREHLSNAIRPAMMQLGRRMARLQASVAKSRRQNLGENPGEDR